MTMLLRNIFFLSDLCAFRRGVPVDPRPFVEAFYRCQIENGPEWIRSDESRALRHIINFLADGDDYTLECAKERTALESLFRDFVLTKPLII